MAVKTLKKVNANGLSFSYLEQGAGSLILCMHGYPDTAHTWLQLMPILAQAGFRVVAPFMRGYPPTSIPQDHDYSALQLGTDVSELISALGTEQAIVIGHDWGAFATYAAASLTPEKIVKMVTVAIPHPRAIRPSLGALWKARHFLTYQFKSAATQTLKRNNFAHVDAIYKRWSPNWRFSSEETQAVKEAFAQPGGAEAALGYYWSFAANRNNDAVQKLLAKKTSVPTLCIVGAADGALDLSGMPRTIKAYTGPYEYKVLPDVGHFLHREAPAEFAAAVLDYLGTEII